MDATALAGAPAGPIGFLGGSFDPVHAGHLQLARDAWRALALRRLVFVPAGQPWQKPSLTPARERVRMLELALAGEPAWGIDLREIERAGPTYTVDTARALRAEAGPDRPLVWILGSDQLYRLSTWHRWQELGGLLHIACADRAGEPPGSARELDPLLQDFLRERAGTPADMARRPAGLVLRFAMQPVDCSATALRAALRAGDRAGPLPCLPEPVRQYIRLHHLYETEHGNEKAATPGD
jgi:nicotinate-nucleotide adenylyltransferase